MGTLSIAKWKPWLVGKLALLLILGLCRTVQSAEFLKPTNLHLAFTKGTIRVSFDYQRPSDLQLEEVRFYLRKDNRDIVLTPAVPKDVISKIIAKPSGSVSFEVPARYLYKGAYQLVIKSTIRKEPKNHVVKSQGRAFLQLNNYQGKDTEFSFRVPSGVEGQGLAAYLRGKDGMSNNHQSWGFYYMGIGNYDAMVEAFDGISSTSTNIPLVGDYRCKVNTMTSPPDWHEVVFRCQGDRVEVKIDGKPVLSAVDGKRLFTEGNAGFFLNGGFCYLDNVVVKDLETGEIIIQDDFEREEIGDRWQVLCGQWSIEQGFPASEELVLGQISIPDQLRGKAPVVELKRRGDAMELWVNGKRHLPLFFSTWSTKNAPHSDVTYNLLRTINQTGIQIISVGVPLLPFDSKGKLDFSEFDAIMTQAALACPNAYFILREMALRNPPDLPESEQTLVSRRPGDFSDSAGNRGILAGQNASMASELIRGYAAPQMAEHIAHILSQPYSERVIGALMAGIGYEGNFGNPSEAWGLYMDVSPAQVKRFGRYLQKKYGTVEALRKSWGNAQADFDNPPLPGLEERTVSDVAGFFDPSKPHSRWVLDFLDMYGNEGDDLIIPILDTIAREDPNKFYGICALANMNIHMGGMQLAGGGSPNDETGLQPYMFHNSMPSFILGIETYGDRKAGGVSINTMCAWESLLRHGKLYLCEADIYPPLESNLLNHGAWSDATYEGMVEVMRREFAHTVLIERRAMWFFDMAIMSTWYLDPRLHAELARQTALGERALKLEHRNVAEILVVTDNYPLRYFAYTTTPLKLGQDIPEGSKQYAYHTVHANFEHLMRIGAPNNMIFASDMESNEKAKLLIFPTQFYCDQSRRERIHQLVKQGAVAIFTGPAGLVNEKSASAENMGDLLGMKMGIGAPGKLVARWVESDHPISWELEPGTVVGDGRAEWYRFYVDDPKAIVLARYDDGKVAIAAKPYGKGLMVYSGVPIMTPEVYRAIARQAGVHIYAEGNDALYADNNFLMIHTKEAGKKQIQLPKRVHEIKEAFTGEIVGRDTDKFEVDLPEKHTAVYYIGEEKSF